MSDIPPLPLPSKRRLLVLRHAKSDWSDPHLADIDRPLAPRGERAALVMGRFLAQSKLVPTLVLCSPARRTRETWSLVSSQVPGPKVPLVDDRLYEQGARALLAVMDDHGGDHASLMLVGHNPDLTSLVDLLCAKFPSDALEEARKKMPTAALCVIDLIGDRWSDAIEGGPMSAFVTPKQLV